MRRLFLHLGRVEMEHPVTGARLLLEDPLPAELSDVLARLRGRAAASP